MALLQRLFQNRRNAKQYNGTYCGQGESSDASHYRPRLDKNKIRLLIIADTEKGRVPYFDSNAIHRIEDKPLEQEKKSSCRLGSSSKPPRNATDQTGSIGRNGMKYQFQRIGSDVKLLEEMMFGAVALAYKGSTLKVHYIRFPPQLVVTKVFYPQKSKPESTSGEADCDSNPNSLSNSFVDHFGDFPPSLRNKVKSSQVMSIPVDVPLVRESIVDSTDDDSGLYSFTSSGSFQCLFPSPNNSSANSYNSLHRRWMRSQTTSLQRQWNSQETLNSMETSQIRKKKQIKLAIGIMFSTSDEKNEEKVTEEYRLFQSFFFAHMALIEGHVERLRLSVERAIFTGCNMIPSIFEALDWFRDAVYDLYTAPRLREPVWLSMMSNVSYRYALCERFIHEFMTLAAKYDNKSTKFFVSTLLSAVLTYHLAWVATVTPGDGTPSKTYLDKHSAKWIDTLAKTHPYNPLWAQLGDLYGAIGNPLRVTRTVVVGRKTDLVSKILYVLSYFIRCSDVHEAPFSDSLPSVLNSECWNQTAPIRNISVEDVNFIPVDLISCPVNTHPQLSGTSESNTCICENCIRASHLFSAQDVKMDFLDPKRTAIVEFQSVKRDSDACERERAQNHKAGALGSSSDCTFIESDTGHEVSFEKCEKIVSDDSGIENSDSFDKYCQVNTKQYEDCKIAAVHIEEDCRIENVQHVQRSAVSEPILPAGSLHQSALVIDGSQDLNSKRPMSVLAQQLAASEASAALEKQKAKIREVKEQFLAGASNSMFEEYFQGDAETKTIDDISEHQRVVTHPLVCPGAAHASPTLSSGRGAGEEGMPAQMKNLASRQSSIDAKPHVSRPTSLNPARCRSVTPTELERRRHLSSTSSLDVDVFDPLVHCQEIPMPIVTSQPDQMSIQAYENNFGRSLLGGYSDHYLSDFVLHGTSDTSFKPKLLHDLQSTLQHSVLDEPVAESVCIIADTDNWTVEVANSRLLEMSPSGTMPWTTSHIVASLIESVLDLHKLKMSAEFCIMHLEDRMQEMYFKSIMLAEYIKDVKSHSQQALTAMLGFDASDLPLLLAIAGTHTPNLALGSEAKIKSQIQ